MSQTYAKQLTKTDTGESGCHQGGICVPKGQLISFFPQLDLTEFNPDTWIKFIDPEGSEWLMRYIYYNGKTFAPPKTSRNEYRITHMSKFFRHWNATVGDSVSFSSTRAPLKYKISILRKNIRKMPYKADPQIVKLNGWNQVY